MKEWLEYALVWTALKFLGALPRSVARAAAAAAARFLFIFLPKFRRVAMINLRIAFPQWTDAQRRRVIRKLVRNLGWMAAEFAHFPRWTRKNIEGIVVLDGHENFLAGRSRGKGVLFLTGHLGAWEVSSFAHALHGFPLHFMARQLDNRRVDALVNRYRCLSGNQPLYKNESARAMLTILRDAGRRHLRELFRHASLHHHGNCPRRASHRFRRRARVRLVGRSDSQIPLALRAAGRTGSHRGCRRGYSSQHRKFHQGHRRFCPRASRSVALGSRALEDSPAGREAAL